MKKDLSEPLKSQPKLPTHKEIDLDLGKNVLFDRNELHEVYKEWRRLFDQYDPPRVAVAEANVSAEALFKYASPEELGQSFNFELLNADFEAADFKKVIDRSLVSAKKNGSSTTWCLNNHDQMRTATKYGLDPAVDKVKWRNSNGSSAPLDEAFGISAAIAGSMLIMALPGSTYIYQGEELGLHEVTDIPENQIQDPQYLRNLKIDKGRDGCRVPLPWTKTGSSFGFGSAGAHLPQPKYLMPYRQPNPLPTPKDQNLHQPPMDQKPHHSTTSPAPLTPRPAASTPDSRPASTPCRPTSTPAPSPLRFR
jgi:alpha-glucosidase